jgi:hypothetical protein
MSPTSLIIFSLIGLALLLLFANPLFPELP